jgi:8-oxo-dGTP pyrophosphatase MutT (NUDIX family)
MTDENPWKIISSKVVYKNPWIQIQEDAVITPTGKKGIYGFMRSNDSVIITVLNDQNELYLVRGFSYPVASWNWELPGGGGDQQDPVTASKRELEEETGIKAETWEKLGVTRVCDGLMTERMTTYLARDISFTGEREVGDEQIADAKFVPMSEVDVMIERGDINDGQTITAIYLAQKWLARQEIKHRG